MKNRCQQFVSAFGNRLDITLTAYAVAHGGAQFCNGFVHRMVGGNGTPEAVQQFLRADNPLGMLDQIHQHIHRAR